MCLSLYRSLRVCVGDMVDKQYEIMINVSGSVGCG